MSSARSGTGSGGNGNSVKPSPPELPANRDSVVSRSRRRLSGGVGCSSGSSSSGGGGTGVAAVGAKNDEYDEGEDAERGVGAEGAGEVSPSCAVNEVSRKTTTTNIAVAVSSASEPNTATSIGVTVNTAEERRREEMGADEPVDNGSGDDNSHAYSFTSSHSSSPSPSSRSSSSGRKLSPTREDKVHMEKYHGVVCSEAAQNADELSPSPSAKPPTTQTQSVITSSFPVIAPSTAMTAVDHSTNRQQQQQHHGHQHPLHNPTVGLVNEGTTCYLNSLLQLLFHTSYFRSAVYQMPADNCESSRIHTALQELFFQMQERKSAARTRRLTDAFGWGESDLHVQHDIQEMATLLRDNLEQRMKGTKIEGAINRLFEGRGEQVVTTLDGSFTSRSKDCFFDIHLPIAKYENIMDSIRSLTAKDLLVGDNKYRVEQEGKPVEYKDAEKGYEFIRFPPVILFHLKRFEMDLTSPSLDMKKVNTAFKFSLELDLREFERNSGNRSSGSSSSSDTTAAATVSGGASSGSSGVGIGVGTSLVPPSPSAAATPSSTAPSPLASGSGDRERVRLAGGGGQEGGTPIQPPCLPPLTRQQQQSPNPNISTSTSGSASAGGQKEVAHTTTARTNVATATGAPELSETGGGVDICGSFNNNSPAIYDLHGVIVHRGSARSGHYYCYIHDWDPWSQCFARWIEFDDDSVRVVSEEDAVRVNFGGPVQRMGYGGMDPPMLRTNNAYILSYVRRADCAKVLAPSPTDIIPEHVKDALRREMEEDERRLREEVAQRKRAVLFLLTNSAIRECVNVDQVDLISKIARTEGSYAVEIVMQRTDKLSMVYKRIAEERELARQRLHENNCRLWSWGAEGVSRATRPVYPLPVNADCGNVTIEEALRATELEDSIRCCLYVEKATDIEPLKLNDASAALKLIQDDSSPTGKWLRLDVQPRLPIVALEVTLRMRNFDRSCEGCVDTLATGLNGTEYRCTVQTILSETQPISLALNSQGNGVSEVQILIKHVAHYVDCVENVRFLSAPEAIPQYQIEYRPGRASLVSLTPSRVLLFFKMFSHVTGAVSFLGSVVTDAFVLLKDCASLVFQLLRQPLPKQIPELLYYEERKGGALRLLDSSRYLVYNRISSASLIVVQVRDVPFVYRHLNVESYYHSLSTTWMLTCTQLVMHEDPMWNDEFRLSVLQAMSDSAPTSQAPSTATTPKTTVISSTTPNRSAAAASQKELRQQVQLPQIATVPAEPMDSLNLDEGEKHSTQTTTTTATTAAAATIDTAVSQTVPTVATSASPIATAEGSRALSAPSKNPQSPSKQQQQQQQRYELIRSFVIRALAYWTVRDVCNAIGTARGIDPRFIRLYTGSTATSGTPSTEPLTTDPEQILDDIVCSDRTTPHLVFFEVTERPLEELEEEVKLRLQILGHKKTVRLAQPQSGTRTGEGESSAFASVRRIGEQQQQTRSSSNNCSKDRDEVEALVNRRRSLMRTVLRAKIGIPLSTLIQQALSRYSRFAEKASVCGSSQEGVGAAQPPFLGSTPDATLPVAEELCSHTHFTLVAIDSQTTLIHSFIDIDMSQAATAAAPAPDTVDESTGEKSDCAVVAPVVSSIGPSALPAYRDPFLVFDLVPNRPLSPNSLRLACHHGDYNTATAQVSFFGHPFVIELEKDMTVREVLELAIEESGVSREELRDPPYSLMVFIAQPLYLPNWSEKVSAMWTDILHSISPHFSSKYLQIPGGITAEGEFAFKMPTLFLNHPKPKEKPGSRYVAQNNPALTLGKRK